MEKEKSEIVGRARQGKFSLTTFKSHKVVPANDERWYVPEQEFDLFRTCIQYGRYNRRTGQWENQQIWCNPDEVRDLFQLLAEPVESIGGDKDE